MTLHFVTIWWIFYLCFFFSFSVCSVNEITTTFRRENTQSSARRTVPRNLQGLICFWFCSQINVTPLYWLACERGHSWCLAHFIFSLPFALFKLYDCVWWCLVFWPKYWSLPSFLQSHHMTYRSDQEGTCSVHSVLSFSWHITLWKRDNMT